MQQPRVEEGRCAGREGADAARGGAEQLQLLAGLAVEPLVRGARVCAREEEGRAEVGRHLLQRDKGGQQRRLRREARVWVDGLARGAAVGDEGRELEQLRILAEHLLEQRRELGSASLESGGDGRVEREVEVIPARAGEDASKALLRSGVVGRLCLRRLQPLLDVAAEPRSLRRLEQSVDEEHTLRLERGCRRRCGSGGRRRGQARRRKQRRLLHEIALLVCNLLHRARLEGGLRRAAVEEEEAGARSGKRYEQEVAGDHIVDAGARQRVEEGKAEGRQAAGHAERL
mmetsp:Transcript_10653/g.35332  ORF Transcript_10653/g.35332 Transcript_10653/m.35332 type:complete len:287 (+) Transcript_10653:302-1162(+)